MATAEFQVFAAVRSSDLFDLILLLRTTSIDPQYVLKIILIAGKFVHFGYFCHEFPDLVTQELSNLPKLLEYTNLNIAREIVSCLNDVQLRDLVSSNPSNRVLQLVSSIVDFEYAIKTLAVAYFGAQSTLGTFRRFNSYFDLPVASYLHPEIL